MNLKQATSPSYLAHTQLCTNNLISLCPAVAADHAAWPALCMHTGIHDPAACWCLLSSKVAACTKAAVAACISEVAACIIMVAACISVIAACTSVLAACISAVAGCTSVLMHRAFLQTLQPEPICAGSKAGQTILSSCKSVMPGGLLA